MKPCLSYLLVILLVCQPVWVIAQSKVVEHQGVQGRWWPEKAGKSLMGEFGFTIPKVLAVAGVSGYWWPKDTAVSMLGTLKILKDYPLVKQSFTLCGKELDACKGLLILKDQAFSLMKQQNDASLKMAGVYKDAFTETAKSCKTGSSSSIGWNVFWFMLGAILGGAIAVGIGFSLKEAR